MQRILVTNAKGGCGKSTIATNLAAALAADNRVSLFDHDPQGSSTHWLRLRSQNLPQIHGVAAYRKPNNGTTGAYHLRVPPDTRYLIGDTPGNFGGEALAHLVQNSDVVLIPVLPSPIDIHAATRFVRDLLLIGKARTYNVRIGVIANRVRTNTIMFRTLTQFLASLKIPFVTVLRDTQNYVKAAQTGTGVVEMDGPNAARDADQWRAVVRWLGQPAEEHQSVAQAATEAMSYRDAAAGKALWKKLSSPR